MEMCIGWHVQTHERTGTSKRTHTCTVYIRTHLQMRRMHALYRPHHVLQVGQGLLEGVELARELAATNARLREAFDAVSEQKNEMHRVHTSLMQVSSRGLAQFRMVREERRMPVQYFVRGRSA